MAREVECKVPIPEARVDSLMLQMNEKFGERCKQKVDKRDTYYSKTGLHADFRMREEATGITITRKQKEVRNDGAEVNQEIEFTVTRSQEESIHTFFLSLGYTLLITKRKTGFMWSIDNLTIEVVEIERLGYFLEIERLLLDSATQEEIDTALQELDRLRETVGFGDTPLEGRYYIEMLQELER